LIRPNWRDLSIHESSPSIPFLAEQAKDVSFSFFFEDVQRGNKSKAGYLCEDVEHLTFRDETFDIFVTQDVMEHVFHPEMAFREASRVLKPNGNHIFTTPKHKTIIHSYARAEHNADGVQFLLPPEYHGNPIGDGRSLVTWDFGADFESLATKWSGYLVSTYSLHDRNRGLDGEFLDVFVITKNSNNRYTEPLP